MQYVVCQINEDKEICSDFTAGLLEEPDLLLLSQRGGG